VGIAVETTQPYYASTYVFVSRKADRLAIASLADPRLKRTLAGLGAVQVFESERF
jgi:ABC-type amino acid transport substrate-binding protein